MTRKRIAMVALVAALIGIGWWCTSDGKSRLQRDVEAIGGKWVVHQANPFRPTWRDHMKLITRNRPIPQSPKSKAVKVSLNLSSSDVTDDWLADHAPSIKSAEILTIQLEKTSVTDRGIDSVAQIPSIVSLALSETQITDGSADAIAAIPGLYSIDLRQTGISARGLAQIIGNPRLDAIAFEARHLTTEVIDALNTNVQVSLIKVEITSLGDLRNLSDLKNVQYLYLSGMSDELLPALSEFGHFQMVILNDSEVSEEAVEAIRPSLPSMQIEVRPEIHHSEI